MSVENTPTQQGGDIQELTPANNPRMQAMAEIAKRAHAEVVGDLADFNEETGTITPTEQKPAEDPPQVQAQDTPDEEGTKDEPKQNDPPAPRMVQIVVDGRPLEVPEDKIIEAGKRTLQKESAADRRLQEAAEKERRAQALLEQAQRASGSDPAQSYAPSQDAQQHQQNTQPATQAFTPEALDSFLEQKLYMRDAQKAAAKFEKDFPEIASDPYLRNIAASIEQTRLDTAAALGEPFGDPFDAYQKAGEKVREWLKQRAPSQPQGATISADKKEQKRSITAVPSASATAPKPQEKAAPTVRETIESMRQARLSGRPLPIHQRSH